MSQHNPLAAKPLALLACVVATVGVAAVWAGASVLLPFTTAWMAIVAALDAVLLLKLANWPRAPSRAALAVGVTAATVLLAQYFVATARIGLVMGLRPFEALPLMSPDLVLLYAQSNLGSIDCICYGIALAVAWALSR